MNFIFVDDIIFICDNRNKNIIKKRWKIPVTMGIPDDFSHWLSFRSFFFVFSFLFPFNVALNIRMQTGEFTLFVSFFSFAKQFSLSHFKLAFVSHFLVLRRIQSSDEWRTKWTDSSLMNTLKLNRRNEEGKAKLEIIVCRKNVRHYHIQRTFSTKFVFSSKKFNLIADSTSQRKSFFLFLTFFSVEFFVSFANCNWCARSDRFFFRFSEMRNSRAIADVFVDGFLWVFYPRENLIANQSLINWKLQMCKAQIKTVVCWFYCSEAKIMSLSTHTKYIFFLFSFFDSIRKQQKTDNIQQSTARFSCFTAAIKGV